MKKRLQLLSLASLFAMVSISSWAADARFTTAHFSGSGNCAICHDGLRDQNNRDVSIQRHWSGSMMANAARDPLWKAKVASELKRNAHLSDVINNKCTVCHAPMANYEAKQTGATFSILDSGGLLDPTNPLHDAAMDGVSCTLCHQIQDAPSLGTLAGSSGHYEINPNKSAYGQFVSPTNPMLINSGYTPTFSAHISDSSVCASCHDLKTPYVDAQGNVMTTTQESEFAEQMVYTEWEFSDYAQPTTLQSCQDCHMPHADGVQVANRPRRLAARDGFAEHQLVGANTVMMNLLQENMAELGVTSTNLPTSIQNARSMLQGAAQLDVVSTSVQNGLLDVVVQVTNTSGHKLPTSYPSRRAFLHFTVRDGQGQAVFESGRINADGSIVGADGDLDPSRIEPHYDLITSADQVQIYEPIMGNTDDQVTYTLLRASQYLKDNRLLPAGFNKHAAPDDVKVWGGALDDADFVGGSDLITYRLMLPQAGSYTVEVELVYQPLQYGYLLDLFKDNDQPAVADFQRMYQQAAIKWEVITSTSAEATWANTEPVDASPTPVNTTPRASFTFSCAGLSCDFDGSASHDPDGTIVGYTWSFGDGASGAENPITHDYPAEGAYLVTLTVTDDGGATNSVSQSVSVTAPAAAEVVVDSMASWLVDGTGALVSQTSVFNPGDRIGILSQLRDQNGAPVEGASVTLEVRDADGAVATTLVSISDTLGDALGTWQTEAPRGRGRFATTGTPKGTYTAQIISVVKDGYTLNLDLSATSATFAIQ